MKTALPRILVIDDLFGRQIKDRPNRERANLCGMYGLRDVTDDEVFSTDEEVLNPVAEAVFFRGQHPLCAEIGDTVENDLEATAAFVKKGWDTEPGVQRWSLVLLDLCFYTGEVTKSSNKSLLGMPEGRPGDDDVRQYFGLRILERLHSDFPELPVIILSSKKRDDVSESFTAHGALGFIPRTESASPELLNSLLWRHGLIADPSGRIVGDSLPLLLSLRSARRVAADRRNILIRGERGTGKELFAHYINQLSEREGKKPNLVAVDSGALSPTLYFSELFGHAKGSFTGAYQEHGGLIVKGDGGDLFLDEIGNMPMEIQSGLLRVIETRHVMPLGANSGRSVDVRFLSATNMDIEEKAATGIGFRGDLLDRLREGGTIVLPPLRERKEDIPLLADLFVRHAEAEKSGAMKRKISADAMEKLVAHRWQGNVRELRNCLFKAVHDHPDVEYLVLDHLQLPENGFKVAQKGQRHEQRKLPEYRGLKEAAEGAPKLSELVGLLERFEISPDDSMDWAGRWAQLESAYSGLMLKLLHANLLATLHRKPANPVGEVKIHPAIKLLTGDSKITASKAADMIKRIFSRLPESETVEALKDPILRSAYDTAIRLRPKRAGAKKSKKKL